jgi:hypothetical protein
MPAGFAPERRRGAGYSSPCVSPVGLLPAITKQASGRGTCASFVEQSTARTAQPRRRIASAARSESHRDVLRPTRTVASAATSVGPRKTTGGPGGVQSALVVENTGRRACGGAFRMKVLTKRGGTRSLRCRREGGARPGSPLAPHRARGARRLVLRAAAQAPGEPTSGDVLRRGDQAVPERRPSVHGVPARGLVVPAAQLAAARSAAVLPDAGGGQGVAVPADRLLLQAGTKGHGAARRLQRRAPPRCQRRHRRCDRRDPTIRSRAAAPRARRLVRALRVRPAVARLRRPAQGFYYTPGRKRKERCK